MATNIPNLTALRLSEEEAAARYLAARKDLKRVACELTSVRQLASEYPQRSDYRATVAHLIGKNSDAMRRTQASWMTWQRAQRVSDAVWTAGQAAA